MNRNSTCQRLIALFVFVCLFVHASSALADDEAFPRPAELEPAIAFWKRVYTEIDSDSGFLHDARNLSVVYRRVDYDRPEIEQYRQRIQEDLRVLAGGKRTGLTGHQQQVLEAWPDGVSKQELAAAANRVRFQLGQSDRFVAGLIRAGAYREHIEQVARERGLPVELAALPHVESSFHPGAYSHANAAGMWQFIRSTGQRFMRIDHIVDERMDPYAATYAAMSLLEYNHKVLGSWPLALTAYNHGAGGLARAVRQLGTDRIEDLIARYDGRAFGFASRNFYPQFLAVVDVERQARTLFGVLQVDPAPRYEEFEMDAYIDASTLAAHLGVSVEQLRFDNPALRPVVWEGGKRIPRGYTVKIQRDSLDRPLDRLMASMPADQMYTAQIPDVSYVVQRGDSLSVIAQRFDTSVSRLASLNQLSNQHRIRVGQELMLPHDTEAGTQTLLAENNEARPADGTYTIRRGDTLSLIASRFGTTERTLMALNAMDNPDQIYPGETLRLPAGDEPEEVPGRRVADGEQDDEAAAVAATQAGEEPGVSELAAATPAQETPPTVTEQVALSSEQLAADPSDYSVNGSNMIEIQASETLGHYADWLDIRTQSLRNLNGLAFNQPVIVGDRLRLDFSQVSAEEFELRRRQYHIAQQENFFRNYRIQDVDEYRIAPNDNIARIARQRYSVPLWLLRQYNPDLDFRQVRVGDTVVFPVVSAAEGA
ncbi:MAG: LysM peptidoglycan-binding domain-containing protein [Pseudohongiellaceae bacterium]